MLNTGGQAEQLIDVAADQRKILDLDVGDGAAEGGIAQVDEGSAAGDVDGFAGYAVLQNEIEAGLLHDREDDAAALKRLEARGRDGDAVWADGKELVAEGAVVLSGNGAGEVGIGLSHGDGGVGNDGAGGIGDGAHHGGCGQLGSSAGCSRSRS